MSYKVRHFCRWTMVVCLIGLLSASPASAGWLLNKIRCKQKVRCQPACVLPASPCPPAPTCSQPVTDCCVAPAAAVVSAPVAVSYPVVAAPVASDCCCDSSVTSGESIVVGSEPMVIDSAPMIDSMGVSEPMFDSVDYAAPLEVGEIVGEVPMMAAPIMDEGTMSLSDQAPVVIENEAAADAPAEPVALDPMPADPMPADEAPAATTEDADSDSPPAPVPADPAPAESKPVDPPVAQPEPAQPEPAAADPFGAPATEPAPAADPAPAAVEDPFGAPVTPAPAETEAPATDNEAAMDDLFGGGAPAADPAPASTPAADPAPAIDDPFGAPAAAPANDPAPAAGDTGLDDLFGGSDSAAAPATDAPATAPANDLFGTPAAEDAAPATDGGLDDIFGTPKDDAAPADDTPATGDSLEDLFGSTESVEMNVIEELPAPKAAALVEDQMVANEETSESDLVAVQAIIADAVTELFQTKMASEAEVVATQPKLQVVSVPRIVTIDPLAKTRVRTWIDNTGQFRTSGRLIEINATNVRLLKSNGRTCTVPKARMCGADAAYVKSLRNQVNDARIAMLTSK